MVTGVRHVSAQVVWVAKDDGSDIIRSDTIVGVGRDYNGYVTARLDGGGGAAVTLVAPGTPAGAPAPDDVNTQLIKLIAETYHTPEDAGGPPRARHGAYVWM